MIPLGAATVFLVGDVGGSERSRTSGTVGKLDAGGVLSLSTRTGTDNGVRDRLGAVGPELDALPIGTSGIL